MHPKRKQRLILIVFLLVGIGIAVALSLSVLNENMNFFYSPAKIVSGEAPKNVRIRAGGMVVKGSVVRNQQTLEVQFALTDYEATVPVRFTGILPDLFREGQGIVALGELNDEGVMMADEVLAKHDENYMPPEVAEALKQAETNKDTSPSEATYMNGATQQP